MVEITSMMANVNCDTTSIFLGVTNAFTFLKLPFKTATGLKFERKNAG